MRIIVDEMPKNRNCCMYYSYEITTDMNDYKCSFGKKDIKCYCTDDEMTLCPYFVGLKETLKDNLVLEMEKDDGCIYATVSYAGENIQSSDVIISRSVWDD